MNVDIMTLFPDSVNAMLHVSILGRAMERGYINIRSHQIRDYTTNKTRDQIVNICWIIEKAREFQVNICFCFIDYAKAFDCVDHNKL